MADILGDTIHWKKLWQLIAGFNNESSTAFVDKTLQKIKDDLKNGLLIYKPSSRKSLEKLKIEIIKEDLKLKTFFERLEKLLGLDALQLWDILCYYLVTEFCGSPTVLVKFTMSETKIAQLLIDIWGFYSSERMFMLKLLGVIIEYSNSDVHPYRKQYNDVLKSIGLKNIRDSLIKQFEVLIREQLPTILTHGDICTPHVQRLWAERNMREIIQILNLLIVVVSQVHVTPCQVEELVILFKEHNFGREPNYIRVLTEAHAHTVEKISYFEAVLFITCMDSQHFENITMALWLGNTHPALDQLITTLHYNKEHSVFLLSWMLFNFKLKGEDAFLNHYNQFGIKALQLNVFEFLTRILRNEAFKDKSKLSKITYKMVYNLLADICDTFDSNGSVSQYAYVYELCAELFTAKSIAINFIKNVDKEEGISTIWNNALEMFPYEFVPISKMCDSLIRCGDICYPYIFEKLAELSIFTEVFENLLVRVVRFTDSPDCDQYVLEACHQPLQSVDYKIPAGCRAIIRETKVLNSQMQRTLVHYGVSVNYWKVLHSEIIQLLEGKITSKINPDQNLIGRVESGIRLIAGVMKYIKNPMDIPEQLVYPTEMVFDLSLKYMMSSDPPMELVTNCFYVFSSLTPLFDEEIQKKLCRTNLLPSIENHRLSYKEYASGECFNSNGIGNFLINVAKPTGQFKFIVAYIDLLTSFFNKSNSDCVMEVRMPGLIFVLLDIFPHVSSWHFLDENERHSILFKCAQIFLKVLQESDNNSEHKVMHKTLVYSLLNIENGTTLLRLVAVGHPYLQAMMEEQTNWIGGYGLQKIRLVQTAIAILMQILRLKRLVLEKNTLAPLEHIIYTQPKQKDALRIVPIVTGYMNHVFNKHLPSLACRLLKRFALEIQMSLLACLDMESDQIRQMFLERLRDETESEDLKTAILEFVAACVERQPGLTEAFFKVHHPQKDSKAFYKSEKHDVAEGILSYMAEYLSVVHKDPQHLSSPLLTRVMNLFHSVWKNHMEMLLSDFRKNDKFWTYFTTPLFSKLCPDAKAYSQILNVISLELYKSHGSLDNNLKKPLEELFIEWKPQLKLLLNHVFTIPARPENVIFDEIPEWLCLLTSWKDFLTISMKFLPFPIESSIKTLCFRKCLDTLNSQIVDMNDMRAIVILSELCMITLSHWKKDCVHPDKLADLAKDTIMLVRNIFVSYDSFHIRIKEALLSTAIYLIKNLEDLYNSDNNVSISILEPLCRIVCAEINSLLKEFKETPQKKKPEVTQLNLSDQQINSEQYPKIDHNVTSAVLSFTAITQLIMLNNGGLEEWKSVIVETSIISNILICLETIIQVPRKMKIAVAAFHTLIHFTRGIFSMSVLNFDVSQYLWLPLLPPKNMVKENLSPDDANVWKVLEWWQLYRTGIDFVRVALERNPDFFMQAIIFVSVHEEFILDAILLPRHSVDIHALQLSNATLELINEMMKYGKQWKAEHESSYMNVMKATQVSVDYAISLLHRPRMLKCFVDGITADLININRISLTPEPSEKIVIIMNKLLDLISLATRCLYAYGPNLLELLADYELSFSKYPTIVDLQFGAPKLQSVVSFSLTFGTIMSAVCLFTKILSYSYKKNKKYLNRLKGDVDHSKIEDHSFFETENDTSFGLFGIRRTVQTIQSASQIANLSTSGNSMLAATDWLTKFNSKRTVFALENIMTFLAAQTIFTTTNSEISNRDQQLIRRELCSELYSFHELVRKKVLMNSDDIMVRQKHGSCKLSISLHKNKDDIPNSDEEYVSSTDEQDEEISGIRELEDSSPENKRITDKSMRVDVIRKLHLEAISKTKSKLTPQKRTMPRVPHSPVSHLNIACSTMIHQRSSPFEDLLKGMEGIRYVDNRPELMSPVKYYPVQNVNISKSSKLPESTPFPGSTPVRGSPDFFPGTEAPSPVKRDEPSFVIKMLAPQDDAENYSPLTDILMTEEDYLHFLSYLFMYLCPMDSS